MGSRTVVGVLPKGPAGGGVVHVVTLHRRRELNLVRAWTTGGGAVNTRRRHPLTSPELTQQLKSENRGFGGSQERSWLPRAAVPLVAGVALHAPPATGVLVVVVEQRPGGHTIRGD